MSTTRPPSRLAAIGARMLNSRPLMRAPIWVFKARAGAVLGSRLLMLEHIGRKSGVRRYVVLEVVDHPAQDRYVVASGFGEKARGFATSRPTPGCGYLPAAGLPHPPLRGS